ncbi:hypothetical protein CLV59_101872 [Chitinophaga dinghuensis]|uniref:Uncharacterized protein n=1 Tax=Chitinophaga dinghuensis TaxID=1539050 RepID=A0A327WBI1_9BACT|nr:hypothetical protein [Chitinophaga dinghuensis]RAJ88107.1 hypothetical protein CLV59_101872 [Chitinophaga dinghuensis]
MEMLALTCPQCGSANVKLLPERNDLAQCNYCNSIFMLPPPIVDEAKPKITAIQEEEEEVDMTEVVYPIRPTPPPDSAAGILLSLGVVLVGALCAICEVYEWKPDHQRLVLFGIIIVIGIFALLMVFKYDSQKSKEFEESEEMQTYIKESKAAYEKSMAQIRYRMRQNK